MGRNHKNPRIPLTASSLVITKSSVAVKCSSKGLTMWTWGQVRQAPYTALLATPIAIP